MKKRTTMLFLLICNFLIGVSVIHAQKYEVVRVNASTTAQGDKIRGPKSIRPEYVNRIRYRVAVKTKTTFTAGPSLALPFIPQVPGGSDSQGATILTMTEITGRIETARTSKALPTDRAEQEFLAIRDGVAALITRRVGIQDAVSSLLSNTKTARDATEGFVKESDSILGGSGGPDEILRRLPTLIQSITNSRGDWPDAQINQFLADVDILENELGRISDVQWLITHKARVDALKDRLKELRESVTALSRNGKPDSPAARFDEAQRILAQWKEIFSDAQNQGRSFFELPYVEVGCSFSFDQNKETSVTLVKQDRLATDTTTTEQELVTVVCSSPFSISGGFAFSSVNEREFVFVPSTKTVTENGQQVQTVINRFGFKNNSSFRPIPLLLLNTRVYEKNDDVALHLSAGAGVDIKTGEAGTDIEYIVGPSISFKRSLSLLSERTSRVFPSWLAVFS